MTLWALGPHLELLRGDGTKSEDFVGFGKELVAPAAGTVVYARDDVADNSALGTRTRTGCSPSRIRPGAWAATALSSTTAMASGVSWLI